MRRFSISTTARRAPSTCAFPAGVSDGSRVRVAGEGERGTGGAKSGDLYLRIRLAPHPTVRAQRAATSTRGAGPADHRGARRRGGRPTLAGKSLRLKIPPTTQNGQVFRLKGHGMPTDGKPDETRRPLRDRRRAAAQAVDAGAARRTSRRCRSWKRSCNRSPRGVRSRRGSVERLALAKAENEYEHQQVHGKSARSGRRRASSWREQAQQPAGRARASARRARRTARRHRARTAAQDERRSGGDRRAPRASCWRRCRRPTAASQPAMSPRSEAGHRSRRRPKPTG